MGNGPGEGKNAPDFKGRCTFDHKSGQIKAARGAFIKFDVGDEIEIRNTANNDANMRTVVAIDDRSSALLLDLAVQNEDAGNVVINRLQYPEEAA